MKIDLSLSFLCDRIGDEKFRMLAFEIADGGNTWKLAEKYSVEKYDVNMIRANIDRCLLVILKAEAQQKAEYNRSRKVLRLVS